MPVITLFLVLAISVASLYAFANPEFARANSFNIREIRQNRQYLRVFTSAFIHVDLTHLLFNMFSLYSFAQYMEIYYSSRVIVVSFFLSVLGGNLFSFVKNRNNPEYTAVGASGGVCGIIFSSLFLMEGGGVYVMFIPIAIPDRIYAVAFILVSYFFMKRGMDRIGHDAHIGGAFTGTMVAIAINPWIARQEYLTIILMFLPFVALHLYDRIYGGSARK